MANVDLGYSFLLGLFAALNPCGFVLLPAYLGVFLGIDPAAPARVGLRRALAVSSALSVAFVTVFSVVGLLVLQVPGFGFLQTQARWAGLIIGLVMVAAGVAGLFGFRLPALSTSRFAPRVAADRSVRTMFLFGVAYAVASIGCTIGLFLSVILSSFGRNGVLAGVVNLAVYGAGMGLLVTALTVALATTRAGIVTRLRSATRHLPTIASIVLTLTGAYLAWYWYVAIFRPGRNDRVVSTVGAWQTDLLTRLTYLDVALIAAVLAVVVITAALIVARKHPRRST